MGEPRVQQQRSQADVDVSREPSKRSSPGGGRTGCTVGTFRHRRFEVGSRNAEDVCCGREVAIRRLAERIFEFVNRDAECGGCSGEVGCSAAGGALAVSGAALRGCGGGQFALEAGENRVLRRIVGVVVVAEFRSGMTTAFVEVGRRKIFTGERKVDRESVHGITEHGGFAGQVIVVERPATGDAM